MVPGDGQLSVLVDELNVAHLHQVLRVADLLHVRLVAHEYHAVAGKGRRLLVRV